MESHMTRSISSTILQSKTLQEIARLFSLIMEEKVDTKQTLHILHAHLAFFMLIIFGGCSPLVAALMVAWFGLAAYQCKRSMRW